MLVSLSGVLPVLPAIFDSGGAIDEAGCRRVLEYVLDAGADGVVFPGLASEYDHLTPQERDHMVALIARWIDGRVPFIVGASAPTARESARHAVSGAQAGAKAAMIITPRDLAADPGALVDFYRGVGARAGIPLMLQNAPAPMGVGLSVEAIAEIVEAVNCITTVKEETTPCGQRITALLARVGNLIEGVFGGAGARYILDEMHRGALGTLPACEITEIHVAMVAAHRRGDEETARTLFERSLPLLNMQAVFRWRLTKEVLRRRGLIESAFVRAPGAELDAMDRRELTVLLQRIADLTRLPTNAPARGAVMHA